MQERGISGGMGAVIGLSDEQVARGGRAAREHGEIGVANANAPGQIVLSGVIPALAFALEMSKTVGARKAVRLTVSVASHSPLMRRARDEFGQILARVPFRDPRGADARQRPRAPSSAPPTAFAIELTDHLVHGVQWTDHHPPHGRRRRDRLRRGRTRTRAVRAHQAHQPGGVDARRRRRPRRRALWLPGRAGEAGA